MGASPLLSQSGAAKPASCSGQRVTSVEIDPGRPPFDGSARRWQTVARAVGLHHATTQPSVIRKYILLHEGDDCTDERRAESERILRALPFLADARVRTEPDSAGGVRLVITTIDEIPVLIAGAIHHGEPGSLTLGNANIGGLGLRVLAGVERGFAYRNGAHLQVVDYGAFGRPLTASVDAARDPLASHVELGISHPFLTDLQHGSWQATYRTAHEYPIILRPDGDNAALPVRRDQWAIGGVARTEIDGLVGLLGGVAMGNRLMPAEWPVVVTDTGLAGDDDPLLRSRYSSFHSARLGGLIGVRQVHYVTVAGLDGLFASQDVMTGLQIGALVAPGVTMHNDHDVLAASSVYAGTAGPRSMLAAQFESEASREFPGTQWSSIIGSGRAAWYYKLAERVLLSVDDEYSLASRARLPTQLTFSDPVGGVRGYAASRFAGGQRNIVRSQLRWARPALIRRSDMGFALFADAGTLWKGDVPYGTNVSAQSVGVSILGSYPTQSKRLYRVDLAFPVAGRGTGRGIEIRFTSGDPTAAFWKEPDDVTRSRLAPTPSSLFAWPGR
jgi:hypothetical protein